MKIGLNICIEMKSTFVNRANKFSKKSGIKKTKINALMQ